MFGGRPLLRTRGNTLLPYLPPMWGGLALSGLLSFRLVAVHRGCR